MRYRRYLVVFILIGSLFLLGCSSNQQTPEEAAALISDSETTWCPIVNTYCYLKTYESEDYIEEKLGVEFNFYNGQVTAERGKLLYILDEVGEAKELDIIDRRFDQKNRGYIIAERMFVQTIDLSRSLDYKEPIKKKTYSTIQQFLDDEVRE